MNLIQTNILGSKIKQPDVGWRNQQHETEKTQRNQYMTSKIKTMAHRKATFKNQENNA